MSKLFISPDDLKKGTLVDVGWYPALQKGVEEKRANTDGSQNWVIEFKIEGDSKFAGVPVYRTFNEKGAGFAKNYAIAMGATLDEKKGFEVDFSKANGSKLQIYIKHRLNKETNQMMNDVADFRRV